MSKLLSLADKPATKEDLGKVVYDPCGNELVISCYKSYITVGEDIDYNPFFTFWNNPKIISEQEYNELVSLVKEAVEIVNRSKPTAVNGYYADLCGNFINKAKGVLE